MSTLASVDDRLPGATTSPRVWIGSKMIKPGFGLILTVKDYLNTRHVRHTNKRMQDAASIRPALHPSQLAPTDLLYRAKL